MKKFIIAIDTPEESRCYVSGSCFDNKLFSTTYNLREAKMFDSLSQAKRVTKNLKLDSRQSISYLEMYDIKDASSAEYLFGDTLEEDK